MITRAGNAGEITNQKFVQIGTREVSPYAPAPDSLMIRGMT